jgi:hypothetical protein
VFLLLHGELLFHKITTLSLSLSLSTFSTFYFRFRGAIWSYKWQLVGAVLKRGVHVITMDVDTIAIRPFSHILEVSLIMIQLIQLI